MQAAVAPRWPPQCPSAAHQDVAEPAPRRLLHLDRHALSDVGLELHLESGAKLLGDALLKLLLLHEPNLLGSRLDGGTRRTAQHLGRDGGPSRRETAGAVVLRELVGALHQQSTVLVDVSKRKRDHDDRKSLGAHSVREDLVQMRTHERAAHAQQGCLACCEGLAHRRSMISCPFKQAMAVQDDGARSALEHVFRPVFARVTARNADHRRGNAIGDDRERRGLYAGCST